MQLIRYSKISFSLIRRQFLNCLQQYNKREISSLCCLYNPKPFNKELKSKNKDLVKASSS